MIRKAKQPPQVFVDFVCVLTTMETNKASVWNWMPHVQQEIFLKSEHCFTISTIDKVLSSRIDEIQNHLILLKLKEGDFN